MSPGVSTGCHDNVQSVSYLEINLGPALERIIHLHEGPCGKLGHTSYPSSLLRFG